MAETSTNTKRITFKHSRPNPLFQSWIEELYDEAQEKGSKLEPMLKEALESLSKYPLPLQTGADCAILKGFGKKLCLFLDTKLEVFNQNIKLDNTSRNISPSSTHSSVDRLDNADVSTENNRNKRKTKPKTPKGKSPKRSKTFKPAHRSGGYAILIALLEQYRENPNLPSLNKDDLIIKAQPHSEESFTRPKPESYYTAWSNMSRLITKGLVNKTRSRKAEFSLTNDGILLAEQLFQDSQNIPSLNDIIFNDARVPTNPDDMDIETIEIDKIQTSSKSLEFNKQAETDVLSKITGESESMVTESVVNMLAGSFDIVLLIDKQETTGASKKNDPTVVQFNKYPNLKHEYRHLKVGDFTWVARSKTDETQELVLPFIVERKRMDDLGHSIKDGRFHEQKFRLRRCGLRNVIYLVENYGSNKHVGLPIQSLMQALANTRVQDGFKVHVTDSLTNSARFLAMMTKRLTIEYKDKDLKGVNRESNGEELMTFTYFNKSSSKSKPLTITETLIKLLLQVKGMSVEKALAITKVYKTPKSLIEAFKICNDKDGELILSNLKFGDLNRNVGPTVSKAVYQLFTIKVDN